MPVEQKTTAPARPLAEVLLWAFTKTSTTASFESFKQRLRRWPLPGSHCLGGCGDRTLTRACLGGTTRESACCLSMTPRKQNHCQHGNWDPLRHGTSLKIIEPVQPVPYETTWKSSALHKSSPSTFTKIQTHIPNAASNFTAIAAGFACFLRAA